MGFCRYWDFDDLTCVTCTVLLKQVLPGRGPPFATIAQRQPLPTGGPEQWSRQHRGRKTPQAATTARATAADTPLCSPQLAWIHTSVTAVTGIKPNFTFAITILTNRTDFLLASVFV